MMWRLFLLNVKLKSRFVEILAWDADGYRVNDPFPKGELCSFGEETQNQNSNI